MEAFSSRFSSKSPARIDACAPSWVEQIAAVNQATGFGHATPPYPWRVSFHRIAARPEPEKRLRLVEAIWALVAEWVAGRAITLYESQFVWAMVSGRRRWRGLFRLRSGSSAIIAGPHEYRAC